jgi:hypothetical protein
MFFIYRYLPWVSSQCGSEGSVLERLRKVPQANGAVRAEEDCGVKTVNKHVQVIFFLW